MSENTFETWALVELFGHQRMVGKVTEATIGGCSFIRVDVPAHNGKEAFTRYLGNGAIYGMTPLTEETAMSVLNRSNSNPYYLLGLPSPTSEPATTAGRLGCDEDEFAMDPESDFFDDDVDPGPGL